MKKLLLSALLAATPAMMFATSYSFSTTVLDAGSGQNAGPGDNWDGISHGQAITWGLNGTAYGSSYSGLVGDVKTGGITIQWAKLTLTGIRDWTAEPRDVLYVDILKGLANGINGVTYNSSPSSYDTSYGANAFVNVSATNNDYNDKAHAAGLQFTDVNAVGAGGVANSLLRADASYMPTNALADSNTDHFSAADWSAFNGTYTDTVGPYGSGAAGSTVVIWFNAANLSVLEQYLEADADSGASPTVGLGFAAECHYYIDNITLEIQTGRANVPDSGATVALLGAGILGLAAFRRRFAK